jgi:DNA replication and repair protein RecF
VRITHLAVRDWRNLAAAELDTDARVVVFHGDNAQGKTNLLEAAWLLATLRSFRDPRPAHWVRHGAAGAAVRAEVRGESGRRRLHWRLEGGQRQLELDGAPNPALDAWFQLLRAILLCPEDIELVRGEPAVRRRFLDRAEFTARPDYLGVARDHRRALQQKAALLRTGRARRAELEPWSERLAVLGARLALRRQRLLAELAEPFEAMHARIAGTGARAALRLRGIGASASDEEALAEALRAAMHASAAEELQQGRVLVGPQRDDVELWIDGRPARSLASQGQARTLVLALKLAEVEAARRRGDAPVFLLDDLGGELDAGRRARLVETVGGLDGQVFITTTHPELLGPLPQGDARLWRVEQGAVRPA